MKSHVIIVRFHYEDTDRRFQFRLAYFRAMVWPRIMAQSDQNFDVAIRCNPWQDKFFLHDPYFARPGRRMIVFRVKNEGARYKVGKNGRRYFEDFAPWEDVQGLEKYDIQSGLDSDDLVSDDYIAVVRSRVAALAGRGMFHVHFQPQLFRVSTLEVKPMMRYGPTRGSAFLSIYQPDKEKYHFVYDRSHIVMPRIAEKTIIIPAGHAWASAHEHNESTGK